MAGIAKLLAILSPVFRFVAPSAGTAPDDTAQVRHETNVDDANRLRAFEIERIRCNPASLLPPRF
ncbi:hypothetical protein QYH69_31210 [Paraburkholderia sp. SARCC-3016]|uniref:hypothetical protein n=1 Tax=Paraburkholderia sp. SARCC-3016 TaxID=3058611 RepID=UPI002809246B|nr:hypothetical protein [Paraburkholderia sp. SARCC-3016]MDQ7981696.1 hypothetical protein [Paraburkholderia sp. SARCC-3016]